jgi:hypothetical protein
VWLTEFLQHLIENDPEACAADVTAAGNLASRHFYPSFKDPDVVVVTDENRVAVYSITLREAGVLRRIGCFSSVLRKLAKGEHDDCLAKCIRELRNLNGNPLMEYLNLEHTPYSIDVYGDQFALVLDRGMFAFDPYSSKRVCWRLIRTEELCRSIAMPLDGVAVAELERATTSAERREVITLGVNLMVYQEERSVIILCPTGKEIKYDYLNSEAPLSVRGPPHANSEELYQVT